MSSSCSKSCNPVLTVRPPSSGSGAAPVGPGAASACRRRLRQLSYRHGAAGPGAGAARQHPAGPALTAAAHRRSAQADLTAAEDGGMGSGGGRSLIRETGARRCLV